MRICLRAAWPFLCILLALVVPARSQAATPTQAQLQAQPLVLTNAIAPTVTVADGDRGGKFFGSAPDPARTHHYYIAAEPELWDYAPEGRDPVCGKPMPPPLRAQRRAGKMRYVEYTDESFGARVIATPRLGILGPVLRGIVGDFIVVTFLNRSSRSLSMHPHGAKYDKDSEGAYYEPRPGLGAAVGPGAKFTYVWKLDENSGPQPGEPASKGWLYHSHVSGDEESNLGLVGLLIVTDARRARPDGTPLDTDREMAALFMIFDESGLGEADREAAEYAMLPGGGPPPMPWVKMQETLKIGERPAINGYLFGNLPGLEMIEGERVRWYMLGLRSENDAHTAHWHGARVIEDARRRTDVVELFPASMKVADMEADNPGSWLFHCHVADHMKEGMFARFVIHPRDTKPNRPSLQNPFFGLRRAVTSLQVKRGEALLDAAADAAQTCELTLEGTVSVFQAFSVFTQPITLKVGQKSITLQADRRGVAQVAGGAFKARNVSQYGVVYGGLMEFALTVNGADWLAELKRLGPLANGTSLEVPLSLGVGQAQHAATARVTVRMK